MKCQFLGLFGDPKQTLGDLTGQTVHGTVQIGRILDLLPETANAALIDRARYSGHADSKAPWMWYGIPLSDGTYTTSNLTDGGAPGHRSRR